MTIIVTLTALAAGLVIGAWLGAHHKIAVEETDMWLHRKAEAIAAGRLKARQRRMTMLRSVRQALTIRKAVVAVTLAGRGHVITGETLAIRLTARIPAKRRVQARPVRSPYVAYLDSVYRRMNQ